MVDHMGTSTMILALIVLIFIILQIGLITYLRWQAERNLTSNRKKQAQLIEDARKGDFE